MKIQSVNHSLEVVGLEFDCSTLGGGGTLAGFETLTIDNTVIFTYEEFRETTLTNSKEIWEALEKIANEQAYEWQDNAKDLRAWLTYRR